MASTAQLAILLTADDRASRVLDDTARKAGSLGSALSSVSKIAAGFVIGGGLLALPGFLFSAAQAAADDAASQLRLQKAVENTGAAYGDYKRTLDDVIKTGMRRGFTDDQTRDSLSLLTAQTSDADEAVRRYALAQDLARGANIDVVTASRLLGKVTEENVNVLARYGISVKEGATETELFGAIQAKFGGQAEAFASTTAGKMAQFKIAIGELKESIGNAVLPALTALATVASATLVPAMQRFGDWVTANQPQIEAFTQRAIVALQEAFRTLVPVIIDIVAFVSANWPIVAATFEAVADVVKTHIEGMKGVIESIAQIVGGVIDLVNALIHGRWSEAWAALKQIAEGFVNGLIASVKLLFPQIAEDIISAFSALPEKLSAIGRSMIQGLVDGIDAMLGPLDEIVSKVIGTAGKVASALGIKSPSTVFFGYGQDIMRGLIGGIQALRPELQDVMSQVAYDTYNPLLDASVQRYLQFVRDFGDPGNDFITHVPEHLREAARAEGHRIAGYQGGTGYVPRTGLALLHRGEAVIPAWQNRASGAQTIVINFQGPVYGFDDFNRKVSSIVRGDLIRGDYRDLLNR
jgi:hypothetical protein